MPRENIFDKTIRMNSIIIMTSDGCGFCDKIKDILHIHKIPFKEIPYSTLMDKYFIKKYGKYNYVPRVILNQEFIGGYNELEDKINNKELKVEKKKPEKKKVEKKKVEKKKPEKKKPEKKKVEKKKKS